MKRKLPAYYRIRKNGVKRYIRFPHHTSLILFFWAHPAMTLDTLFLAFDAIIYLYLGTMYQDRGGLRLIGNEWKDYRKGTCLLLPTLPVYKRMFNELKALIAGEEEITEVSVSTRNSI